MSPETKAVLLRLKRRLGRERARYRRLYETTAPGSASRERAYGEENVCSLAMRFIDEELRRTDVA